MVVPIRVVVPLDRTPVTSPVAAASDSTSSELTPLLPVWTPPRSTLSPLPGKKPWPLTPVSRSFESWTSAITPSM